MNVIPYRIRSTMQVSDGSVSAVFFSKKGDEDIITRMPVQFMAVIEREIDDDDDDEVWYSHSLEGFGLQRNEDGTLRYHSVEEPIDESLEFLGYETKDTKNTFYGYRTNFDWIQFRKNMPNKKGDA